MASATPYRGHIAKFVAEQLLASLLGRPAGKIWMA
jgi:hypothetical protein